jgi:hypothetical protein
MANRDSTGYGLKPYNKTGGNSNSTGMGNYTAYEIANGNSTAIYKGSVVIPLSTGYISLVGAADGGTVAPLGVFMGCEYVSSTTGKPVWSNYWPGSGADSNHPIKAFVADDPNQVFVVASDASLTSKANTRASVFLNADMSSGTSGSTANGQSTAKLGVSTLATTAGLMLRLTGWVEDADNQDFSAAGIPCLVRFTTHFNADSLGIVVGTPATTGV